MSNPASPDTPRMVDIPDWLKCPKCGALWGASYRRCHLCGHPELARNYDPEPVVAASPDTPRCTCVVVNGHLVRSPSCPIHAKPVVAASVVLPGIPGHQHLFYGGQLMCGCVASVVSPPDLQLEAAVDAYLSALNGTSGLEDDWTVAVRDAKSRLVTIACIWRAALARPALPQEVCICAAIRCDDGTIIRGHRHDDCIITAAKMRKGYTRQDMQGFITSLNRYVSREEGAALQNAAGIVSHTNLRPIANLLFSEDLY